VLLDRLLDRAGLEVAPVAVCDLRRGAGVELPALADAHVHCVVRGSGTLRVAGDLELPLSPATLAIVPARVAHVLMPDGGYARLIKVGAATSSDHVPALTAGGGEPGMTLVSGRIQASRRDAVGLFEGMTGPVAVALSDIDRVHPLFETLLDEQSGRAPGNRRMTALLMQQFLMHVLRKLYCEVDCPLPWLGAIRDPGLARALDAMLRSPTGQHSLKSLAAAAGMSRSSFSARFAQAFGRTPLDWLKVLRVPEPRASTQRMVAARSARSAISGIAAARRTRARPEA
jgi:AraC family transcriptional activator of mtrCDE